MYKIGFFICLMLVLNSVYAVDRYMATTGVNAGACDDENAPCLSLQYVMNQMQGGDTLYIEDGVYTGSSNRIWQFDVPPAGSPGNFTTIRAKNIPCQDGVPCNTPLKVKFTDGATFSASAGNKVTSYVKFWGIRWDNIGTYTGWDNIYFKQVASQGIYDGNSAAFAISGKNNLLEDVVAFGKGRYKFLFYDYDFGATPGNNLCRRCVARHDWAKKNDTSPDPIAGFSSYFNRGTACVNCMVIDSDTPSEWMEVPTEISAAYYQPNDAGHHAMKIKGSIALNSAMAAMSNRASSTGHVVENFVAVKTAGGLNLRGETDISNITIRDVGVDNFAYRSNAQIERVLGRNDAVMNFGGGPLSIDNAIFHDINDNEIKANSITNNLALFGYGGEDYSGFTEQEINSGSTVHSPPVFNIATLSTQDTEFLARNQLYPIRVEATDDVNSLKSYNLGARIMHPLGPDGTFQGDAGWDVEQTDTPLWPWPLEEWVQAEMRTSEYTSDANRGFAANGETLTNYVWGFLGATPPLFDVSATPNGNSIQLTWSAPSDAYLNTITRFHVYDITGLIDPVVPGSLTPVATVEGNSTFSATINNLTVGQSYEFAVTAVDSIKGESSYSYSASVVPVTTAINLPQNDFLITPANNNAVAISGTADQNSSVELYVNSHLITTVTADSSGAWSTTLDLSSNQQYVGALSIYASSGGESSNTVTGINLVSVPSRPVGLSIGFQ